MGVLGDIQYRAALVWKVLNGNTTTTRKFLRQVGTGAASAAPAWDTLQAGDLPSTAVTPASYGDATHVAAFTVDQQGRLTAASSVAITDTGITQLTGDVTAGPGSGSQAATIAANAVTTTKINNAAVTLAKIANAAASSKLVGSGATGSGSPYSELTLGTNLSITGSTLNAASSGTVNWAPPVGLRLSASTNTYVPTTDVTGASTLYWTTVLSGGTGVVTGYDSAALARKTVTQKSLSLSTLTSGKNYNVYYDYDGDALALGAVWTNDTTPSETLADESGAPVLSSDHTKLYLGVIRTTGTTTTEDSGGIAGTTQVGGKRFVWNAWNAVKRGLSVVDKTDTWAYATNTIRQADGAAGNQVEYVTGDASTTVEATAMGSALLLINTASAAKIGVGIDSTTVFSGLVQEVFNGVNASCIYPMSGRYVGQPGIGYHIVTWLESGATTGTCTFRGDNAGDGSQSGLHATIFN